MITFQCDKNKFLTNNFRLNVRLSYDLDFEQLNSNFQITVQLVLKLSIRTQYKYNFIKNIP